MGGMKSTTKGDEGGRLAVWGGGGVGARLTRPSPNSQVVEGGAVSYKA